MDYIGLLVLLVGGVGIILVLPYVILGRMSKKRKAIELQYQKRQIASSKKIRKRVIEVVAPSIVRKLEAKGGFSSLSKEEQRVLFTISQKIGNESINWHPNEVEVIQHACSDQVIFNVLQLNNSRLAGVKQEEAIKNISNQLSTMNKSSRVSSMIAINQLGRK